MITLNGEVVGSGIDVISHLSGKLEPIVKAAMEVAENMPGGGEMNKKEDKEKDALFADLLHTLMRYILIAASRTIAGGDGFFVLDDLYGAEGMMLCPETVPVNPSTPGARSAGMLRGGEPHSSSPVLTAKALDSLIKPVPRSSGASLATTNRYLPSFCQYEANVSSHFHSE